MPQILYRPPKLPPAAERADESAASIRRRYTSNWLAAVTCAVEADLGLPPLPENQTLFTQLRRTHTEGARRPRPSRSPDRLSRPRRVLRPTRRRVAVPSR